MAGTSKGMAKTLLVGARVSTHLNPDPSKNIFMLYTPANLRAGDQKKVNARLEIPVMVNIFGRDNGDGFRVVAWGKLADIFARNLNRGKEMHFLCEPTSYLSDVRSRVDGSVILDKNGAALQVRRTSYRIIDYAFGADSFTTINEEIQHGIVTGEGKRPANWNNPAHADNGIWKQMLQARNNTYFSPAHEQSGYFGFAKVVMPKTAGYQVLYGPQYEKEAIAYNTGQPAPAQGTPVTQAPVNQTVMMPNAQPAANTGGLVNQVNQTLNPQTPVQNQPVMMNQVPVQPGNAPF
jgi:hypothetical protein